LHDARKIRPQTSAAVRTNRYTDGRFITSSQIRRPSSPVVRSGALLRARDTRLRPSVRDRPTGTAQNRTDDTDCLATGLVYRRLDTSSPLSRKSPGRATRAQPVV
jgi:hypothetical protein